VGGALTCIAPIRPLQLCADGGYQPSLGVLGVPLIMVPDTIVRARDSKLWRFLATGKNTLKDKIVVFKLIIGSLERS
jgi:hypothetical protein